jgi:ABC-type multidrug transport system ATPase subunit
MNTSYTIAEPLIVVENLSIAYNEKVIIRDIGNANMPFVISDTKRENIEQGQITAVLGRSGRGKSTLFKALSGILEPLKGDIKILNENKPGEYRNVREGDMGFVQQIYPLSRNQTVLDMLKDAAKQGGISASKSKEMIDDYLKDWGLIEQKNLSPNQLSGGQRQRVAIIEQLLCNHIFIIFDEPFSGLDVCNIEEVKQSFHKINTANEKNTIIFSTHDIEIAVELADQIYIIGYERNEHNEYLPGGTIVGSYDLKQMGLAWKTYSTEHMDLIAKIKHQMSLS